MKSEELLGSLLDVMAQQLLDRIKSGEATPADFKNARELLKDNGITCEVIKGSTLDILKDDLPFDDLEEMLVQ